MSIETAAALAAIAIVYSVAVLVLPGRIRNANRAEVDRMIAALARSTDAEPTGPVTKDFGENLRVDGEWITIAAHRVGSPPVRVRSSEIRRVYYGEPEQVHPGLVGVTMIDILTFGIAADIITEPVRGQASDIVRALALADLNSRRGG